MAKVLILTSRTGGGHVSLAEALRDELVAGHDVEITDPQPKAVHRHYRLASRHANWLWAAEYRLIDSPRASRRAHRAFSILMARRLRRLLDESRPDLVLTTYPFLGYEASRALDRRARRVGSRTPLAVVFSDLNAIHNAWFIGDDASAYLANTRETHTEALAAGIDPEKLHLTGCLVRQQFREVNEATRPEVLSRLGFDPQGFTAFVQGGGEGSAKFARGVRTLLKIGERLEGRRLQVILAAGTNRKLIDAFAGVPDLRVLPFTREIAPYMAAADVIMGKAGGGVVGEAIALGKPIIVTSCIAGQEEGNPTSSAATASAGRPSTRRNCGR
jgi:UDP-N-acetylglucosamine:LPS N-acetylglucosamine transferase